MFHILWSLFAFIIAIGLLVTVHEYGHFWVARRCGVKVLRFSIGFGRPLIQWIDKKGTEICIAAIPLGGYVKMLDAADTPVSEADRDKAFNYKSVWVRIAVVIAGPLMNILFAIFCFWLMYLIGIKGITPLIGSVDADSIAARAGLRAEQEIIEIDGKHTPTWRTVSIGIMSRMGEGGDLAMKVRDFNTEDTSDVQLDLATWEIDTEKPRPLKSIGIVPFFPEVPLLINKVVADGPAAQAGLKAGDKIVEIENQAVSNWRGFAKVLKADSSLKTVDIRVLRNNESLSFTLKPKKVTLANGDKALQIGISSKPIHWPKEMIRVQRYGIGKALVKAWHETWHMFALTAQMLWKVLRGLISPRNISGPIGVAEQAGAVLNIGIAYYIGFLGLISVSMALLNIFPIPMLDGGHLMYYVAEICMGRPVSAKTMQIGFKLGGLIIVSIMVLALLNDISRFEIFN